MELLLVRHGRIRGVPMRPRDDSPLSQLGEEQARLVGDYLAREAPYALLACSPLLRARQTAQIVGACVGMDPLVVDALTEMTGRELRWIVLAEVAERLPLGRRELARRAGDLLRMPLIGRVSEAITTLVEQHSDQRVLLIVHGGVIWGTLTHFFPAQRATFSKGRQVANGSLTRIRITPHGAELVALNQTAHLGDKVTY